MPCCSVNVKLAIDICTTDEVSHLGYKSVGTLILYHEVERGYVGGYGNVAIVRIDNERIRNLREGGRHLDLATTGQKEEG